LIVTFYGIYERLGVFAACRGTPLVHGFSAGGWLPKRASNVIFCSRAWQDEACRLHGFQTPPPNSVVLPPFFYPNDFAGAGASGPSPRRGKICLHLGRVQWCKGASVVFDLAKLRGDWTFWIAGCADLEDGVVDLGQRDMRRLVDYPNVRYWESCAAVCSARAPFCFRCPSTRNRLDSTWSRPISRCRSVC
jgi:hypothetical protein